MSQQISEKTVDKDASENGYTLDHIKSLVGLNNEPTNTDASGGSTIEVEGDGDNLVEANAFEEEVHVPRKLWQIWWAKLLIVAIPLGVVAFVIGGILVGLTGGGKTSDESDTEVIGEAVEDPAELEARRTEEEIAELKTANALGNQASVLASQQPQTEVRSRPQETGSPAESRVQENQAPPERQPDVPQTRVVARPEAVRSRPVSAPRPVVQRPTPIQRPTPMVAAAAPRPTPVQTSIIRTDTLPQPIEPPVDPYEAWERLNALGSYGRVSEENFSDANGNLALVSSETDLVPGEPYIPVVVSNSGSTVPILTSLEKSNTYIADSTEETMVLEVPAEAVEAEAVLPLVAQEEADDEYSSSVDFIMQGSQSLSTQESVRAIEILPGVSAQGEFIVPMAWSGDLPSSAGAIVLTSDLISDSTVVMPKGTQLTVELASSSSSGMVDLRITSIILPNDSYEEMQLPASAITIQSGDGSVLTAKEILGSQGERNRLTRNQALLGAIGQIGSVLNRPNSSSSAIGPTGAISSTDYGSGSIIGAVLEGSANAIINQRAQENQRLAESLEDRDSILVLEEGTSVEIFVNQRIVL